MRSGAFFGGEFIVNFVNADGLPFGSVSLFGIPIASASAIGQLVLSIVIVTVIFGYSLSKALVLNCSFSLLYNLL
jgi:hypothetical protein